MFNVFNTVDSGGSRETAYALINLKLYLNFCGMGFVGLNLGGGYVSSVDDGNREIFF